MMSILTRMKSVMVVLLLLLFSFALSQDVFDDRRLLQIARQTLNLQPDGGQQSQAEVERIFAHHPPDPAPAGPLQRAMNAQPALYAALLFTVFREYFAEVVFPRPNALGQRDPLLVMLTDYHLLPERYTPTTIVTLTARFGTLRTDYIAHLVGMLIPADQAAAVLAQVGVLPDTNDPDPDQLVAVPALFQPLLVRAENEPMPAEQRYGPLEHRFLRVYVARYLQPINRKNMFVVEHRPLLRLAVLRALYWMLVVRPFQAVIRNNRGLFPGINPNELAPAQAPVPAPIQALAPAIIHTYVFYPARGFALAPAPPPPPLPQRETVFDDAAFIAAVVNQLEARRILVPSVWAVNRLFQEGSAFQRAMNAQPPVYATVLFTVFGRQLAPTFLGEEEGKRDHLLMLLSDHHLLPRAYAPPNLVTFPWLKLAWRQFLASTLVDPPLRLIIARPEQIVRQGQAAVFVPPLFRPFLLMEEGMEAMPYYALWNTFAHYVSRYPAEIQDQGQRGRHTTGDGVEQSVRRSHLMALYWLLVEPPFQQVIQVHRNLFEGIDPVDLIPEDVVGIGGGGNDDDNVGGGGGPPPPNPPPSPPRPLNPPHRPQPATIFQQSQPGTCSASQPVSASAERESGGNEGGTSSTSPDVKEAAEILLLLKQRGKSAAPDDRGGSPAPPSKKHKPEDFPKDPDGGAGAGAVARQV